MPASVYINSWRGKVKPSVYLIGQGWKPIKNVWVWTGTAWKPVAGTNIVVVSTMPASPVANTLYIVTT